jgi:hypothetical protein
MIRFNYLNQAKEQKKRKEKRRQIKPKKRILIISYVIAVYISIMKVSKTS